MHVLQWPYRQLRDGIVRYEGSYLFADVIQPWLEQASEEVEWLRELKTRLAPEVPLALEENWRLYALSRIVQILTLSFAPRVHDPAGSWRVAAVSRDELETTMGVLGLEPTCAKAFHPFFHEIATVITDRWTTRPEIESFAWPGFRLGPLLISRAGCIVRASPSDLCAQIAQSSTLYWAYARNNRPTADLSDGWGSNSQWRTEFRLDFEVDGTFFYNVGGAHLSDNEDEDLNPDLSTREKIELLRHRCFVRCRKLHGDRWPYDWSMVERPGEPLRLLRGERRRDEAPDS